MPKAKYIKGEIFTVDISWTWNPCSFVTVFIRHLPCKIPMKSYWYANLHWSVSVHFYTLFLDLPLLNPFSPLERLSAWTLQLQQASCQARFLRNAHTSTYTACKHEEMYEARDGHASCTQRTHKQRRIKRKVNVSLRVHLEWKQTRLRRLKRWHCHCFHNHFSSLIRGTQQWVHKHLENGGHDLLTGAKYSTIHFTGHLGNTVTSFYFVLNNNNSSAMSHTAL